MIGALWKVYIPHRSLIEALHILDSSPVVSLQLPGLRVTVSTFKALRFGGLGSAGFAKHTSGKSRGSGLAL